MAEIDKKALLLKRKELLERKKQLLQKQTQEKPKEGFIKKAFTPLLSEEQAAKIASPIASPSVFLQHTLEQKGFPEIGQALGSISLGGLPGIGQMTPRSVSQQTSPIAILSNLMLLKGLQVKGELPVYPGKHLPQIMNKDYVMKRARGGAAILDEIRDNLGKAKEKMLQKIGGQSVNVETLQKKLPILPKNILSKLDDPIYKIERLSDGSIKPTIGNMDKIKGLLADNMSGKEWFEATPKVKASIKQAYGAISEATYEANPAMARPLARYHKFMRYFYNDLNKTLRTPEGAIAEKKLRGAFSPGAERRFTKAWERLGQADKQVRQIVKDMEKFTSRQILKKQAAKMAWRTVPWIGGAALLKDLLGIGEGGNMGD